ncbi:hypothetical protein IBJ60_15650, partial [Nocardioides sp. zg-578]|nr:hypothetical protein [Nocardioides marmotae]MTB85757.1 hypothetical protein [Nocardioides marmotae]
MLPPKLRGLLTRLAAATVLVAAAGAVVAPAPAQAAACASAGGVTAVVDHNELGGGVQQVCVTGGGGDTAAAVFTAAGFPLTYAQRQPGFVCRVGGLPADDPCVNTSPTDAYWALYWSDGTNGSWAYSSAGAGSLTVPDGAYVAFSWQGSTTKSPPSATPTPHRAPAASPSPQPAPSAQPTRAPGAGPTRGPSTAPAG